MDTETVRQLVEILGTASADARSLLWAFVVKEYLEMVAEWCVGLFFMYGLYRGVKFAVQKEFWKHI